MIRYLAALACLRAARVLHVGAERLRDIAERLTSDFDDDGRVPAQQPVTQETVDFLRSRAPRRRVQREVAQRPLAGSVAERYARARKS